jgi:hypothetical protein
MSSNVRSNVFSNTSKAFSNTNMNGNSNKVSMTNQFTSVADKVRDMFKGKSGIIIGFVLLMLAFLLVIIYILMELRSNSYKKGKPLTRQVINLSERDGQVEIPASDLPPKSLGDQYTYAFWIYLTDFNQTKNFHKLVFYRGEKDTIKTANPIVMMDEVQNNLHFVLKTRDSSLTSTDNIMYENLVPITEKNYFMKKDLNFQDTTNNKHLVVTVNNIPFNRWVHYTLSVKDNVVTIFQDGEIYIVKTVNDFIQQRPTEMINGDPIKYNVNIDDSQGTIFIGKNPNIGGNNTINGYFSKMDYFNYAMNVSDVLKVYKNGPFSTSWLQKIGLKNYGMRSPIYKLTTVA